MEFLLHYAWQHRLCGERFTTQAGECVEVIDPGVHNLGAGPDFFNAKVRIGGVTWAGNIEIHVRTSDWHRHGHSQDPAYRNVILHVVGEADAEVDGPDGKPIPQICITVPPEVLANYRELLAEENYPPCYRVIPSVPAVSIRSWLSRLTVERLEHKMQRIEQCLARTAGDWERAFFITLARGFGFGTNADTFERWAYSIEPQAVGKHRDNEFQVEAFFMGQAGLLAQEGKRPEQADDYYLRLKSEYDFLRHKFGLIPLRPEEWKFGRLRPQNFPYVRLSQLARLYHLRRADFSRLLEARTAEELRDLFRVGATDYWQRHYAFGEESRTGSKELQKASLDLLLINTAAPTLFAYARSTMDEALAERAFELLESLPAERNYITRSWERAGIKPTSAADSQALIQLRTLYCERKDCLRCRFGAEYLRHRRTETAITAHSGSPLPPQPVHP